MYNFYLKNGMRLPLHGRMRKLLLIMKLTTLILITVILHVSATSLAQKVTLQYKNVPLADIFNQISTQTGYDFAFTTEALKDAKPVTINVKNEELKDVLNKIFEGQNLDFSLDNKIVVIKPKEQSFIDKVKAAFAAMDVTGRITDENNQPLAGATITVKGESNSTVSDGNGFFTLKNVQPNATIVITFIGYDKKELAAQANLGAIKLSAATSPLDEVKVIAYGQTTERLSVGNVSAVTAKQIEQQPVSNPLLALEGRVPGLFIQQSTGLPGSGVKVRIQGENSISKGNDPLYVVDGLPYISQMLPSLVSILGSSGTNNAAAAGAGNPLSFINPDDIESISVLKDADATAIYGSRAANGAILITTKKGKAGAVKTDINLQTGYGQVTGQMKLLNTSQYLQMRHEAFNNDGIIPSAANAYDLFVWDTTRYTNWQKVLIGGKARYTDLHGSVSGGSTNTQFLAGMTYHKETTVFPGDLYDQKGTGFFNLNSNSSNQKFKFTLSASYLADDNHLQNQDLTGQALRLPPIAPALYNPDGSLNWAPASITTFFGTSIASSWTNPYAYMNDLYKVKTTNLIANSTVSYSILPNLIVKSAFSYNSLQSNEFRGVPLSAASPENRVSFGANGRVGQWGVSTVNTWIIEPQINYKKAIGKGTLDFLAGSTIQQNDASQTQTQARGFNSDAVIEDIKSATTISILNSIIRQYKYTALYSRLSYIWDDKYIANLSGRRDGSSRFGEKNQFHDFWSIGAGWIFSEELFVKKQLPFLSYGKVRGSYGTTGSDQIDDYQYLSLYNNYAVTVPYRGNTSLVPANISNPYLQWEETRKLQFGIDLGFLADKILVSAAYSRNRSSNELLSYNLPIITGFGSVASNFPATVQNDDWEFTLQTQNIKTKDFTWTTNFNLTIPRNKLIAFPGLDKTPYAYNNFIGQPINNSMYFDYAGVDPTTGLYTIRNKQGQITSAGDQNTDRIVPVSFYPKFYGGFQNSIHYKRFDLDFLFMGVKQLGNNAFFGFGLSPGQISNQPINVLDRWQTPGDNVSIQKYTNSNAAVINAMPNAVTSTAAYSDASYIRLKNLSLSWQIPEKWKQSFRLQSCRIYVQGQNLLTITKYPGLDPENLSTTSLPPLRVMTFGIKLSL